MFYIVTNEIERIRGRDNSKFERKEKENDEEMVKLKIKYICIKLKIV